MRVPATATNAYIGPHYAHARWQRPPQPLPPPTSVVQTRHLLAAAAAARACAIDAQPGGAGRAAAPSAALPPDAPSRSQRAWRTSLPCRCPIPHFARPPAALGSPSPMPQPPVISPPLPPSSYPPLAHPHIPPPPRHHSLRRQHLSLLRTHASSPVTHMRNKMLACESCWCG